MIEAPEQRGEAALLLGRALYVGGRSFEAVEILDRALDELPDGESDLAYRLEGELIGALAESVQTQRVRELFERRRKHVPGGGVGRKTVVGQLSTTISAIGSSREEAIALALEAVGDDVLLEDETSDIFMWTTTTLIVTGEYELARNALDRALEWARRRGSMQMLVTAAHLRARLFRFTGALADAEADAQGALDVLAQHDLPVSRPWLAAVLGDVLIERGLLDDVPSRRTLSPLSGAATRRAGRRAEARELLRRALALAQSCGAGALEAELRPELLATRRAPTPCDEDGN